MPVPRFIAAGCVATLLAWPLSAGAHIKNEETQYPDIDFSPARFDIVLLAAAGMVPETPVFEPDRPFTRKDLAVWLALGKGKLDGGENPDVETLARKALTAGLIETLDGDATFADLDRLFFGGTTASDRATQTPTKAEAASYVAAHLSAEALALRGLIEGPAGTVGAVASKPTDDGDNVYILTIGQTSYPMYAHGRVARGPTDLLAWEGRTVARTFVRAIDGRSMWTYLEAKPIEAPPAQAQAPDRAAGSDGGKNTLLYALVGAIVVLGAGLFFRGRRAG